MRKVGDGEGNTSLDSFHGIFHLEDVPVGTKIIRQKHLYRR